MRKILLQSVLALLKWIFNICVVNFIAVEIIVGVNSFNVCPDESTPFDSRNVVWRSAGVDNEIVLSSPPCLDQSQNLIARICSNNTWIPKNAPTCHKIVEESSYCPRNFIETHDGCIFITKLISHPWEHRYILRKNTCSQSLETIVNSTVWYPVTRKTKFGHWWSTSMEDYGTRKKVNFHVEDDKKCAFFNVTTKQIQQESCDAYHYGMLRFYKQEHFNLCPDNCISAGLGTQKCYCLKNKDQCENVTEITVPLDKKILSNLTNHTECYVNAMFVPPDLSLQGYKSSLGGGVWRYTKQTLNCSICSIKSRIVSSQIVLSFDEDQESLFLTIYRPEGLYKNLKNETVFCFTNADGYEISRLQVRESYKPIDNSLIVLEIELKKYMGLYWCDAFEMENINSLITSNTVVAYKDITGHEFALRLDLHENHKSHHYVPEEILEIFSYFHSKVRIMEIFESDKYHSDYLLHISTGSDDNVTSVFIYVQDKLKSLPLNMHVVYFKSSEYCLPENTNSKLSWPQTKIDTSSISNKCCLQSNGIPVTRYCGGDFLYGAEWFEVKGNCLLEPPETSKRLEYLVHQNLSHDLLRDFVEIINTEQEMPVSDLYYTSKVLENIENILSKNTTYITDVTDITNALMNVNPKSFVQAQEFLNVTDNILDSMDDMFGKAKEYVKNEFLYSLDSTQQSNPHIFVYQKENIIVHITNPFATNISGIVVYEDNTNNIVVGNLLKNSTYKDIEEIENLKLAVFVPENILQSYVEDIVIITTVFFNDRLFVRQTNDNAEKPVVPIVSVIIPGHGSFIPGEIPIIYKPSRKGNSPKCAFWDYGRRTKRKRGKWSKLGGKHKETINNGNILHVCYFTHLTHFSLLLIETDSIVLSETDDTLLHIINLLADFLTIIGLIGIFLTAVMFSNWRKKAGTKILLNMSIAIALEVIITQILQSNISINCQIFGLSLHYIVLCKFCWMLVYAFLQYIRFVKVLGPLPDNIVVKSLVFGWAFPLIPVLITVSIDPLNYSYDSLFHMCYPERWALLMCYIIPIFFIIIINAAVFCIVMYQVVIKKIDCHTKMTDSYKLQMQLATLLFFILGIPMLLTIIINVVTDNWIRTILIYIFSITSNVQGFILFLFYVIFNDETRKRWSRYYDQQRTSTTATSSRS